MTGIALRVNGRDLTADVEPRTHLADLLREELLLTGTHLGCEHGVCGACTLMLDGEPVRSCLTLAATCGGADVRTIEGFDDDALMDALRRAFTRHHALQCGYCTPGMLATGYDIVRRLPGADEARVRAELAGNLCRCTGYRGIVDAIVEVAAAGPPAAVQPMPRRVQAIASGPTATTSPAEARPRRAIPVEITDGTTLQRRFALPMTADAAWTLLRSIETVVGCVPGAAIEPRDGDELDGSFTVAIGPMRAAFNGRARVTYDEAARSGVLTGAADDAPTRSTAEGALRFAVTADGPDACVIAADITYRLKGPLAQFGRPAIVADIVDRLLGRFTANLQAAAAGQARDTRPVGGVSMMTGALWSAFKAFWRRLSRRQGARIDDREF